MCCTLQAGGRSHGSSCASTCAGRVHRIQWLVLRQRRTLPWKDEMKPKRDERKQSSLLSRPTTKLKKQQHMLQMQPDALQLQRNAHGHLVTTQREAIRLHVGCSGPSHSSR